MGTRQFKQCNIAKGAETGRIPILYIIITTEQKCRGTTCQVSGVGGDRRTEMHGV